MSDDVGLSLPPIRVLAVDDHPLLREGIAGLLEAQPDVVLVAEAADGQQAVERFAEHLPDVTLMDIQMPRLDGLAALAAIRSRFPEARIVMLTTYKGDVQARRALEAGARGYLLKSMLRTELLAAIRTVHAGARYVPAEVAAELATHVGDALLSEREIEVLRRVAEGGSNKRIAAQLAISEDTVKAHLKHILAKLGASDRTHAVTIALRRGLLQL